MNEVFEHDNRRYERNVAFMKSPQQRHLLLLLIPANYVMVVIARLLGGTGFPESLWDLGKLTSTFVSCVVAVVLAVAIHWSIYGRRRSSDRQPNPSEVHREAGLR
ncbi:MAG: hypothetical protein ACK5CE_10840 [Actinomycetes bacterium]